MVTEGSEEEEEAEPLEVVGGRGGVMGVKVRRFQIRR